MHSLYNFPSSYILVFIRPLTICYKPSVGIPWSTLWLIWENICLQQHCFFLEFIEMFNAVFSLQENLMLLNQLIKKRKFMCIKMHREWQWKRKHWKWKFSLKVNWWQFIILLNSLTNKVYILINCLLNLWRDNSFGKNQTKVLKVLLQMELCHLF